MTASPLEVLARMPPAKRRAHLVKLDAEQIVYLLRSWKAASRPEQRAPTWMLWRWWLMMTGRGFGKNRSASEWVVDRCEIFTQHRALHHVGLLNRSFNHVKKLQIQGVSGIAQVCERRGHKLLHAPTALEGELRIWQHGIGWFPSFIEVHTADDPDRVRGVNLHTAHADEAASWRHKVDETGGTAFSNLDLGLRGLCPPGLEPQGMVTTTPKPVKLIKDLVAGEYGRTAITRGSMFDNANNLAIGFIESMLRNYLGTRLGAQELEGQLLEDIEGALWTYRAIESDRVKVDQAELPEFSHIAIGVDPTGGRAECGIIVVGVESAKAAADPMYRHAYVLEDASLKAAQAHTWAKRVVDMHRKWRANVVVAERNYGGDMVREVMHSLDPMMKIELPTASRGKHIRAEPVSALYDQRRVHHWLEHVELEQEMTTWVPGDDTAESPNRLDALVWALNWLGDVMTARPVSIGLPGITSGSSDALAPQIPGINR